MTRRVLVVAETDPADSDHGKLFGLDPNQATGVAIPAFRNVSTLPAAGSTPGEAVYDTAHSQGFVWDGTAWRPIAPNPIKTFATEAALLADVAAAVGVYATAGDTGNLFVRRAAGWAQVGIKQYATAALLLADAPTPGCVGEALDEGSLWEMGASASGASGNWRCLNIRELADTTAVSGWANAGNAVGSNGCNIGDEAVDVLHDISYIRGSSGWRPDSIWEDTEANIRAAAWCLNGQEAIATDTGKSFVRVAGKWEEAPIQHFPTEAGLLAATPRDGVMAWADDTAKVYARAGGRWVGMNTGFSDPTPIGTIAAFPTATMPAGWLLCDGSAVPAGTDFDALRTLLGASTVPDLRGQFLRGASTATDLLLQKIKWSTGKPTVDFTTTASLSGVGISVPSTGLTVAGTITSNGAHTHATDSQGAHTHTWGQSSRQSRGGGDYLIVDGWNDVRTTSEAGAHSHTAQSAGAHTHTFTGTIGGTATGSASGTVTGTVNGGGDSETAPDHIKIHWGIKARFASVMPSTALLVNTTTPVDGEQLVFDAASGSWMNKAAAPPTVVSGTAPATPRLGQQWFDTSVNTLKVCTAVTPAVIWTATSPPMTVGPTAPTNPQLGQQWFDTTAVALKVCTAIVPAVVWSAVGASDPLPIGAVSAFPTHTMPAGWLHCDGATIPAGVEFDELRRILGGTTVPDLRGQFLRGASSLTDTLLAKVQWTTGRPRSSFTTDSQGDHFHLAGVPVWDDPRGYIHGRDVIGNGKGASNWDSGNPTADPHTSNAGSHTHTITGGGDSETAPDHVKIHWGIKARHATAVPSGTLLVNTAAPANGQVLKYDSATGTWGNKPEMVLPTGIVRCVARVDFGPTGHQRYWDGLENKWVTVFHPLINLAALVPVGNIAQLQMNVAVVYIHSTHIKLRGGFFEGSAMPGMSLSSPGVPNNVNQWVQSTPQDDGNNTASLSHFITTTVSAGQQFTAWLQANMHGSSNMDSYYHGGIEVLDMGPASAVSAITVDWNVVTPA